LPAPTVRYPWQGIFTVVQALVKRLRQVS